VVFTWGIAGNDVLPAGWSTVEVLLHADGDDTVVELVHRGLPEARRDDHRGGWAELLATLAKVANPNIAVDHRPVANRVNTGKA